MLEVVRRGRALQADPGESGGTLRLPRPAAGDLLCAECLIFQQQPPSSSHAHLHLRSLWFHKLLLTTTTCSGFGPLRMHQQLSAFLAPAHPLRAHAQTSIEQASSSDPAADGSLRAMSTPSPVSSSSSSASARSPRRRWRPGWAPSARHLGRSWPGISDRLGGGGKRPASSDDRSCRPTRVRPCWAEGRGAHGLRDVRVERAAHHVGVPPHRLHDVAAPQGPRQVPEQQQAQGKLLRPSAPPARARSPSGSPRRAVFAIDLDALAPWPPYARRSTASSQPSARRPGSASYR